MADAAIAGATRRRPGFASRLVRRDWRGAVAPLLLLAFVEIVMDTGSYQIAVAAYRVVLDGSLLTGTIETLGAALGGLAIGGMIGVVLGVLFGMSRAVDRLMMVTVESIRPIPSAAIIPVVLLAFGFGYRMEIFLILPGTIFPILIFTRSAVAGTEPCLLDVSRLMGLGYIGRVLKIVVPAALPRIFVGFRLSAALALVIAVTTEVVVNPQGLGSAIMVSEQKLDPASMYAVVIWLGIIGWGLNAALVWMQRRLFGPAGARGAEQ